MTDASREPAERARTTSSGGSGRETVSGATWLARLAGELGVPVPSQDEMDALLGLAGIAAHASERTAAPLSTWLVGRAGIPARDANALAARVAEELGGRGDT
ncbi:MAG: DUF6457 domain-containing protein [Acidimicrobiales bacterium]